jgi:hypothetical protein
MHIPELTNNSQSCKAKMASKPPGSLFVDSMDNISKIPDGCLCFTGREPLGRQQNSSLLAFVVDVVHTLVDTT